MAEHGAQYRLTPSEVVSVVSGAPEAFVVEATYAPAGKPPPAHVHPSQDEHFEVLDGEVTVRLGGEPARVLAAGDVLEIPRGRAHRMWNAGAVPARVRWETRPAGRTEAWFAALDATGAGAKMPGPLVLGPLLHDYDDVFQLAGPRPLVKALVATLAALGRLAGRAPAART
jgi:quercetin dioxygenase-like cupin family protein